MENDQINRTALSNIATPERSEFVDLMVDVTNNRLKGVTKNAGTGLREVLDFGNASMNLWNKVVFDNGDLVGGKLTEAYTGTNHPEVILYDVKDQLDTPNPTITVDLVGHSLIIDFGGAIAAGSWKLYYREMLTA